MKWQFNKYLMQEEEQRQKRLALRWVIGASILVTLLKLGAFLVTDSNAILSDLLESLINLAASIFAMYSLIYSARPRDHKHPFGHGKIEFLAATIEGSLIFTVGIIIIGKGIYNIVHPQGMSHIDQGIGLIALGAGANFGMGRFLLHKSKQLNSVVLAADSRRLLSDCYSSVALVLGLVAIFFTGLGWLDSAMAIGAGFLIIRTGYKLVKQSVKGLLDAADNHLLEDVVRVLRDSGRPAWIDIKNMRVSDHRMYLYVDCEITMPWYWNLQEVNDMANEADVTVNEHFKERVELFVQAEPCKPKHCPICRIENCPVRQFPYNPDKDWKAKPAIGKDWAA